MFQVAVKCSYAYIFCVYYVSAEIVIDEYQKKKNKDTHKNKYIFVEKTVLKKLGLSKRYRNRGLNTDHYHIVAPLII